MLVNLNRIEEFFLSDLDYIIISEIRDNIPEDIQFHSEVILIILVNLL